MLMMIGIGIMVEIKSLIQVLIQIITPTLISAGITIETIIQIITPTLISAGITIETIILII
jgi:hypothetical protein